MKHISPIWAEALPPPLPTHPGGTLRCDVAVVGAGFAGLSAALHLLRRRPGARVVVLEAGRVGAGASGATTGMLSPGVGQDLPGLIRRLGPGNARALYLATLDAVRDAERLARDEQIACELELCGQLVVAGHRSRRLERFTAALAGLGLPFEPRPGAVRLPVAGTLHPGKLLAGLVARVTKLGGVILEGSRVRSVGTTQPVSLELEHGTVVADEVVIATAGFTPGLGVLTGRVLPVHLQVLVTAPIAHPWPGREGVLDARRLFSYWRLTNDDRLVFGGGRPRYRWRGSTAPLAPKSSLERELHHVFPDAHVEGGWTGVIGYVADALPAIHRWTRNPSVVHAVGWCGHGVALSLASGAWVTKLLCDGAAPQDLPWFRAKPPHVPFEAVRWLSFRAAVGAMSLFDRMERR
ncbi:MAG: FAD-binding oxidoreductase [Myxococcaceae bacterium]|nr:FAD-binding oxidoreductase [Myxococcaceae bacterium]